MLRGMEKIKKLRWINQEPSILSEFLTFWQQRLFTDCTIICGGEHFPVHRLVLASCSDYFKEVFDNSQCSHPIIIMNDISSEDLEILLNYIYEGNSVIPLEKLSAVIKEGQALKIKGFHTPTQLVSTTSKTSLEISSGPDVAITGSTDFELTTPVKYPVVVLVKLENTVRASTPKQENNVEFVEHFKRIKTEDVKKVPVKIKCDFNYEDRKTVLSEFHSNEFERIYASAATPELNPNSNGMNYSQDLVLQLRDDTEIFSEVSDEACFSKKDMNSSISVSEQKLERVDESSQTWFYSTPRKGDAAPRLLHDEGDSNVGHSSPHQNNEGIVSHSSQPSYEEYGYDMTSMEESDVEMDTTPLGMNDTYLTDFEDLDSKDVSSNLAEESPSHVKSEELSIDISALKSDSPSCSEEYEECSQMSTKENTGVSQPVPQNFINRQRPCPFCLKPQRDLSRHIKCRHRKEPEVIMALRKSGKECREAFKRMRKYGISKANEHSLKTGSDFFYSERKPRWKGELVKCSNCLGFYLKRTFNKHRLKCMASGKFDQPIIAIPVSAPSDYMKDSFNFEVKSRFHDDVVGQLIKSNDHIMSYGKERYDKIENIKLKKAEATKNIMYDMRRMGNITHKFLQKLEEKGKIGSLEDMFLLENFDTLMEAVHELSDGKKSQKLMYGHAIKNLASHINCYISSLNDAERLKQMGNFIKKFKSKWSNYFAEYEKFRKDSSRTEKQASLPSLEDVTRVRNYIIGRLQEIDAIPSSQWDYYTYVEARRVALCRLIFLNSQHAGETCKLAVDEWQDALSDKWIDKEHVESLDEELKELFCSFKIAFQPHNREPFVPTLIPKDCIPILAKLADQQVRKSIGAVTASNIFLFPSSHGSECHSNWSSDISVMCSKAKTFLGISTSKIHRRTSSKFISLDIPEKLREVFFQHIMVCRKKSLEKHKCSVTNEASIPSGKRTSDSCQKLDSLDASATSVDRIDDSNGCVSSSVDTTDFSVPISLNIKRSYHRWSKQQEQVIRSYFRNYIEDVMENKCALPSREVIKTFLEREKLFEASGKDKTHQPLDQIGLIKTKVFNERTKWRRNQCRLNDTTSEGDDPNHQQKEKRQS